MKKIILFLLLLLFTGRHIYAQQVSIGINESMTTLELERGESRDIQLSVANPGSEALKVKIGFSDFTIVDDKNNLKFLPEGNQLFGLKDWLKTQEEFFEIPGGQTEEVSIEISVPENASVGSHYGSIYFETIPEVTGENFNQVIVNGRVNSLILVNIKGEASGKGELKKFETARVIENNVPFNLEFSNQGNIHYIPHGEVKVESIFGKEIADVQIEKHFVFPGQNYSFSGAAETGRVLGIYKVQAAVVDGEQNVHEKEILVVGKYFFVIIGIFILFIVSVAAVFVRKKRYVTTKKQETEGDKKFT